ELVDAEMSRLDAVERRERPAQHVVDAPVLVGALDREQVRGLLDDADDRTVAPGVGADRAELFLGEVPALPAEADALLHLADCVGEREGLLLRDAEDVEGEPLRRARAHSREPGELRDQVVYEGREHRPILPTGPAGPGP